MATILLIIIYISFIGLGLPGSVFGTVWPAVYTDLSLPFSYGSFVTMIISCGTIVSSIIAPSIINRFGTSKVAAFSTLLTALALIGFSFSGNLACMCLCAIPLGIGAGAIDIALNNYVALHYNASHMSFLHCFYGVGVSVSPYIISLVINSSAGWRGGYRIVFLIQLIIAAMLFISLPLWNKIHPRAVTSENENKNIGFLKTLKIPGVKIMCGLFITSCAIETVCGCWGSTFFVEYKHLSPESAARIIIFYYFGITLGRFLSGILVDRLGSVKIIQIGMIVLCAALLCMILPGNILLCTVGMFLIGLGNGPMFPNFNFLAPQNFGADISQSVIGAQMAAAYMGILAAPALCGIIAQNFGMVIFSYYLIMFYIIMVILCFAAKRTFMIKPYKSTNVK